MEKTTLKKYVPYGCILAAGILWGFIGIFTRNLYAAGISTGTIVLLRNIGGAVVLGTTLLIYDRSLFKVKLRHLPYFFGTGIVSLTLFNVCYFTCQQMCSLAVAAILLYTSPAFVVILSAILWKDKISVRKLAALGLTVCGCVLVSGIMRGGLSVTPLGLALGVGSGFCYGLYSIFGRYALKHYKPYTVTFYTFVFAAIGALFIGKPAQLAVIFEGGSVPLLAVGLIILSTVLPYLLYTNGLARTDSGKAAIMASIEPVVAAILGIVAFGEPAEITVFLGLGCILYTVYILR